MAIPGTFGAIDIGIEFIAMETGLGHVMALVLRLCVLSFFSSGLAHASANFAAMVLWLSTYLHSTVRSLQDMLMADSEW